MLNEAKLKSAKKRKLSFSIATECPISKAKACVLMLKSK